MSIEPGNLPCGNSVEKMDRAYREANRLVVAAGVLLAGAGVTRSAPEMKALAAALRAINHSRVFVVTGAHPAALKEIDRDQSPAFGRRLRRAAP
jgi:hypothetical protein